MNHPPTMNYSGPNYGGPYGAPAEPRASGLGVASLVLGIIALVFAIIPCLWGLALLTGLVGLVLGIIAWATGSGNPAIKNGTAVTGTILSGIAIILAPLLVFVILAALGMGASAVGTQLQNQMQQVADVRQVVVDGQAAVQEEAMAARQRGVSEAEIARLQSAFEASVRPLVDNPFSTETQAAQDQVDQALAEFRAGLEAAPIDPASRPTGDGQGAGGVFRG